MMFFAFVVLCALALGLVYAFIQLGQWPKKAALERGHPQADAINVLSWGGLLLTAMVGWLIALTWAHMKPRGETDGGNADLTQRIQELEARIDALQA